MKVTKFIALTLILCLLATSALAKPKGKSASPQKATAGERIANETANSVADVLTGTDSSTKKSTKGTPPGLKKKGKTPPGWDKGKKTGWNKEESGTKSDSPIKQMVKKLFGQE